MKFCVLMSTYNGKNFLKEQLDSIISQEFEGDLVFFIRDDGSKDGTIGFLIEYKEKNHLDMAVISGNNCGPSKSFLELIRNCPEADMYAFCDQDDVWKNGKIKRIIEEMEFDTPCLWYSNYDVVDSKLNVTCKEALLNDDLDDLIAIFYNTVPGCVMAFNHSLLMQMRKMEIDSIRMHDIMAINIAYICGKVLFCNKSYVLYRQHGNNTIGYGHKTIDLRKWLLKKLQLMCNKEPYSTSAYAKEIIRNYGQLMPVEQRAEYVLLSKLDASIWLRIKVLGKYYMSHRFDRTGVSIRCKVLLGLM